MFYVLLIPLLFIGVHYGKMYYEMYKAGPMMEQLEWKKVTLNQEINDISTGDEHQKYIASKYILNNKREIVWTRTLVKLVDLYKEITGKSKEWWIEIDTFTINVDGTMEMKGKTFVLDAKNIKSWLMPIYWTKLNSWLIYEFEENIPEIKDLSLPSFEQDENGWYDFVLHALFNIDGE